MLKEKTEANKSFHKITFSLMEHADKASHNHFLPASGKGGNVKCTFFLELNCSIFYEKQVIKQIFIIL